MTTELDRQVHMALGHCVHSERIDYNGISSPGAIQYMGCADCGFDIVGYEFRGEFKWLDDILPPYSTDLNLAWPLLKHTEIDKFAVQDAFVQLELDEYEMTPREMATAICKTFVEVKS